MFVGGTFSTNQSDLIDRRTGDCGESSGCLESTFSDAKSCYTGYSNNIAAVSDNVVKNIEWSGLSITCNDAAATSYYVSLTSAEFDSFTYTTIGNCNYQALWFINIRGTDDVSITGASFPSIPGGTVYNVVGCGRTITVHDTDLAGSFLAPCSYLNQPNGVINGKVVAESVVVSLQINRENTCPQNVTITIPVVVQVPSIESTQASLSNNAARVGDSLTADGPTVVATNGNNVALSGPITAPAGKTYFIQSNSFASRTPVDSEQPSTASVASMTVALVVALIALLF
jgi:choice-of-anchor A domain-containing protein